jgi:hypothetical protein
MVEPKVRLSLTIPGAVMLSSQDCEKMSQKEAYDYQKLEVIDGPGKGRDKVKRETLHIYTRKSRPATQSISISREAYDFMLDHWTTPKLAKTWKLMSIKQKLDSHFAIIAAHFNASSFSYEILED